MIKNSGGGDILVLRVSGTDAYNPYIYGMGGVNSVATLVLTKRTGPSSDPFVLDKVKSCEGLFFAGGDQYLYYSEWRRTPLSDMFQYLISSKYVTIGGTSAGMMIQASFPYTAQYGSVLSSEALSDPYNRYITLGSDFIQNTLLANTVLDSHFVERDRMGRTVAFLARLLEDGTVSNVARGVAVDQQTALLIDQSGKGQVVSRLGNSNRAYLFETATLPSNCKPGEPLTFRGIQVQSLQHGDSIDLATWTSSGHLYTISAVNGVLQTSGNNGNIY